VENEDLPTAAPLAALVEKLRAVPKAPGCYLIKNAAGQVLYVGKARSLRARLRQHFAESRPMHAWHELMLKHAADFDYIVTNSEVEALLLEATLIKKHRTRYNIRLADDKSYPYLLLTDEPYPRLMIVRDLPEQARAARPGQRRGFHDPKKHEVYSLAAGRIFGPYADARSMRQVMRLVTRLFGLRQCTKPLRGEPLGRPCVNKFTHGCGACDGMTPEEYAARIEQAAMFLSGHTDEMVRDLARQMSAASESMEFERAAVLRDRLRAIRRVTQEQTVVTQDTLDRDVLAAVQEADRAVVAQLVVRAGKLRSQNQMVFTQAARHGPEEALLAFMTQHYPHGGAVPREILVSHDLAEAEEWEEVLRELRGRPVTIRQPKRGDGKRLLEMATRNADLALARLVAGEIESKRMARGAVEDLGVALSMREPPRRIECYDVSNTGGHLILGSMVVFTDGLPDKKAYRQFRIRTVEEKPDDYAAMAEMLDRRLTRAQRGDEKFLPLPDVILVDGGKGQLGVARQVLTAHELDAITTAALAKEFEEVHVPGLDTPLNMEHHRRAQFLLQRLRDEAHRFAITRHRALRDKKATESILDKAPGIGPARRKALLKAFPSVEAIARASLDELTQVKGISRTVAEALKRYLIENL
jgi:excinuclease ABC subunit C